MGLYYQLIIYLVDCCGTFVETDLTLIFVLVRAVIKVIFIIKTTLN